MVKKINDGNEGRYIKEQLEKINPNYKNEVNLKTIGFISNYMIKNRERFYHKTGFDKAYDRLKNFVQKDIMIRRLSMKTITKKRILFTLFMMKNY